MELKPRTKPPAETVEEAQVSSAALSLRTSSEQRESTILQEADEILNPKIDPENLIPTGSTLLNCACSDNVYGGFGKGTIVNVIGDSSSGKTFLLLTALAEMCYMDKFNPYDLIFDDAEAAFAFDSVRLFGPEFDSRIRRNVISDTVENVFANVMYLLRQRKPFIYVLDSLDSVSSKDEQKRVGKMVNKERTTEEDTMSRQSVVSSSDDDDDDGGGKKKDAGSYKTEKAKMVSEMLRVVNLDLAKTESLLIVISQVRDAIGKFGWGEKQTRSGGRALTFYASHEMWLSIVSRYTKTVSAASKKKEEMGVDTLAKVTKNKLTGKRKKVDFPIFYDYGVDDIGSCVNFLVEQGYWKKSKNSIIAPEFDFTGVQSNLVNLIGEKQGSDALREMVQQTWNQKEEMLKLNRPLKFS